MQQEYTVTIGGVDDIVYKVIPAGEGGRVKVQRIVGEPKREFEGTRVIAREGHPLQLFDGEGLILSTLPIKEVQFLP